MGYVSHRLEDLAMDLIVEHLRKKYNLTEQMAIYGSGQLAQKLQSLKTDFRLYVVAHGACDAPLMMRKTRDNDKLRSDRLGPRIFARELYDALPHGQKVQVKLAMCDGSTEHTFVTQNPESQAFEKITSSFASLTAGFMSDLMVDPTIQKHLDVSNVFIGGAIGAAYWDKDVQNAPRFKRVDNHFAALGVAPVVTYEKKSRAYFCPAFWKGKAPVNKQQVAQNGPVYCYFPFAFELKKPLQNRV